MVRGRGEGHIEQIPCGHYRAAISNGTRPDGKRDKRSRTFQTKREAAAWLRQQLALRDRGQLPDANRFTLGEWIARWVAYKSTRVEKSTFDHLESVARAHIQPRLGLVKLRDLKPHHLTHFFGQLEEDKIGRGQQRNVGACLRQLLREAVAQGLLAASPMDRIKLPKYAAPEHAHWTAAEVGRFRSACRGHRLESLFVLALDTGMRIGEILGLHWDDLDLDAGTVRVAHTLSESLGKFYRKAVKTKSSRRRLRVSGAALACLRQYRKTCRHESGYVFRSRNGTPLRRHGVYKSAFVPLTAQAGVPPIRIHDLRHTHATLALAAGASLRAVAARLGHSSPSMTLNVYAHALPEQDQQICEYFGDLLKDKVAPAREERGGEEE